MKRQYVRDIKKEDENTKEKQESQRVWEGKRGKDKGKEGES